MICFTFRLRNNTMFKGYKTYITGALGILGAIAAYLVGDVSLADAGQLLLTAVLGMTIRSGIKPNA